MGPSASEPESPSIGGWIGQGTGPHDQCVVADSVGVTVRPDQVELLRLGVDAFRGRVETQLDPGALELADRAAARLRQSGTSPER